jgi:hypothetical protein
MGTAFIAVVGSAAAIATHASGPAPRQNSLVTGGSAPRVPLSPMRRAMLERTMGPISEDTGTVLARSGPGDEALLLVGVQANGWTCLYTQHSPEHPGDMGGGQCGKPAHPDSSNNTGLEGAGGEVIYPQIAVRGTGPTTTTVISGAAPAGSVRVVITTSDGRSTSVATFDAGKAYGHLSYFIIPWVGGTSTLLAYDNAGTNLACGTTARGNRCPEGTLQRGD